MTYAVQNLTLVADCDTLLALAAKERADLDFKRLSEERMTLKFAATAQQIDAELQSVSAMLAALETIIATLPEGPAKDAEEDRRTRLEYRKWTLENRKEANGAVALLEKEMDLSRSLSQLTEVDGFVEAVRARKAALESQQRN